MNLSNCWLWYSLKANFFCSRTCFSCCSRFIFDFLAFEYSVTSSWIPSESGGSYGIMSRWSGSVAGRFKFVWISLNFNRVFLLVKFSNVFESLPKLMSFDLHSSFRTLVCSLYQVRDSDKCFADSALNNFSSVLILSIISFFSSEIIVSSGLGICIASKSLAVQHCVKSAQIRSFFWSVFSCIRTEYRKIRVRKNSLFGHFSRSGNPPVETAISDTWSKSQTRHHRRDNIVFKICKMYLFYRNVNKYLVFK